MAMRYSLQLDGKEPADAAGHLSFFVEAILTPATIESYTVPQRIGIFFNIIKHVCKNSDWMGAQHSYHLLSILGKFQTILFQFLPREVANQLWCDLVEAAIENDHKKALHAFSTSISWPTPSKETSPQVVDICAQAIATTLAVLTFYDEQFVYLNLTERLINALGSGSGPSTAAAQSRLRVSTDCLLRHIEAIFNPTVTGKKVSAEPDRCVRAYKLVRKLQPLIPALPAAPGRCPWFQRSVFYQRFIVTWKRLTSALVASPVNDIGRLIKSGASKVEDEELLEDACKCNVSRFTSSQMACTRHCSFRECHISLQTIYRAINVNGEGIVPILSEMAQEVATDAQFVSEIYELIDSLLACLKRKHVRSFENAFVWDMLAMWWKISTSVCPALPQLKSIDITNHLEAMRSLCRFQGVKNLWVLDWHNSLLFVIQQDELSQLLQFPSLHMLRLAEQKHETITWNPTSALRDAWKTPNHLRLSFIKHCRFDVKGEEGTSIGCVKRVAALLTESLFRSAVGAWDKVPETGTYVPGIKMSHKYIQLTAYLVALHVGLGMLFPYRLPETYFITDRSFHTNTDKCLWLMRSVDPVFARGIEKLREYDADQIAAQELELPLTHKAVTLKNVDEFIAGRCMLKLGGMEQVKNFQYFLSTEIKPIDRAHINTVAKQAWTIQYPLVSDLLFGSREPPTLEKIREQSLGPDCPEMEWTWRYLETRPPYLQSGLLSRFWTFVTGMRVFNCKTQIKFYLQSDAKQDHFPIAVTCANSLYLPQFSSYEKLESRFDFMLREVDLGVLTLV